MQHPRAPTAFLLLLTPDPASKKRCAQKTRSHLEAFFFLALSAAFIRALPECTAAEMSANDQFMPSAHLLPAAEIRTRDESR